MASTVRSCLPYIHPLSLSALPYVMIGLEKKKEVGGVSGFESMGRLAEGSCTNFFMLRQNQVITPAISEGCIDVCHAKSGHGSIARNGYFCL